MPRSKRKPPPGFDENPEWTTEIFRRAVTVPPGTSLVEAAKMAERKARGRPKLEKPKQSLTLRIDADVIDAYRKLGEGWQTAINNDLRKARKLKAAG